MGQPGIVAQSSYPEHSEGQFAVFVRARKKRRGEQLAEKLLRFQDSFLADQVAASARPHLRGVHRARRNVTALSGGAGDRCAGLRQRHLSFENDVGRLRGMRVVGIIRVWPVLPDIGMQKSFAVEQGFQRFQVRGHASLSMSRK